MTSDREGRQFRLLTLHCVLWSLAMSLASGFVGAYLLHLEFGIATTITMYAALLGIRFGLRAIMLPIVRYLGMNKSLLLGTFVVAFQFAPLIRADEPLWLCVWILVVSAGECIYWPIFHAANAMCGGGGRRGRPIAFRQMATTAISVVGPVAGGTLLTRMGPGAEFRHRDLFCACSRRCRCCGSVRSTSGASESMRQSVTGADPVGLCAFAADGWMCAGTGIAWSLLLFTTLGSSYDTLGWASSAAAMAGALAGLAVGAAIDRGHIKAIFCRGPLPSGFCSGSSPAGGFGLGAFGGVCRQRAGRGCRRPVCAGAHERGL